ncbi:D-aminoacylase [Irregularibacter muris]|uniref:D-aminoacylase n=1 Tax=Irregularibacter muris TaxID=1796619 RepID=A0AAE3HE40_9FIRM|nr:D-aminoacylase [Irregularibacter muris]MCR1897403.1 D-aminoacylase [Irregularibacter muris]
MFDYILKNGLVVDGTRQKPYMASVCIQDGKVAEITTDPDVLGKEVINVEGKIISPGFIDLHTHSDACPLHSAEPQSMIHQGVTTEITGNCGISLFPSDHSKREEILDYFAQAVEVLPEEEFRDISNMDEYVAAFEKNKFPINIGMLVGHGTLRAWVMGFEDREPTREELGKMKRGLEKELKSGCYGMSLGLIYPPGSYGKTEELVELSKVLKENNGILTVHMRNESKYVFEAVGEMIEVAEKSGVHLHISHLKLMGTPQWHKSQQLLDAIEDARQRGCRITCDQYPYHATSTGLSALVPGWAQDGGNAKMIDRLKTKDARLLADIAAEMKVRGGPEAVAISSTHRYLPEIEDKNIEEISKEYKLSPEETVAEILIQCEGHTAAIYYSLNVDDVLTIMKDLNIAVGSDGYNLSYDINYNPHPRSFGTFPRFLKMVRENNLMPLEDAIYKITGLPGKILNLSNRGTLKVGNIADITVFGEKEVEDTATFDNPRAKPLGIYHVFVGGVPGILNGEQTSSKNGLILQKQNHIEQ